MFRVYCGNLSPAVNEGTLRDLFDENGIEVAGNILVKRNYAFVDCPDQVNVDKAIDKLNQYSLLGSVMQVEPSNSRRRRPSNKIQIRNLPSHVTREETESLVSPFGNVQKCEQAGAEALVYVTFETPEQAQQAVSGLNGFEFQDRLLKVDFANNQFNKFNNNRRMGGRQNGQNNQQNRPEYPLRMLVGSEFVGAVIGRQGQTIHGITTQTRARVDIHKREHLSSETLVTIKGSPESATEACKEIYKVVQTEAQSLNKGEYPCKILCPNSVCGRIIGKQGNVIKAFMDQTGAHIIVSSATDMGNYYVDRVITITGSVDGCSKAEALLSEKMRKCLEQDTQSYNQQMNMFGGMPHMGMMGPAPGGMGGYQNMRNFPPYGMEQGGGNYYPGIYGTAPNVPPQQELEVTYLYIPENTVGAVIGSKGSNIKEIMRLSNARIKILPQKNGEMNGERKGPPPNQMEERKVILTGSAESQWKAQFYIFDKIKTEGGFQRIEEVHLRSEVMVPRSMVGRIIGKGGQNVREMQRVSGAIVKVPEVQSQNPNDDTETAVSIIGHFYAMQPAQRRIRSLINQRGQQGIMGGPPPQRRPRREPNGN